MNGQLVLRLGKCGTPMGWLSPEGAAGYICKGAVTWSLGESTLTLRGGINRKGLRTTLDVPPIIAIDGVKRFQRFAPALSNTVLFRRDRYVCLYCGEHFQTKDLSRDHVKPRALGGADTWTNTVTACKRCNSRKGCRTPEDAGMPLLAVPYQPNLFEYTALENRRIIADQMDFLQRGFSSNFRSIA